jgi:Dolichyl-phosphate-mannose-protein mannosyltransferase
MTRRRWGLVALGLAFFVYAASAVRVGFAPYDDAVFTYGGLALARGEIPYEDFWTLYNPGQFLLLGAFFRYVSESVLAFRMFESVLIAASGVIVWDICRRLYSARAALVVACVFVLWMGAGSALYPFHENHTLTSLFLVVASLDLLLVAVPAEHARPAAVAGACAGLCFVIRQDAALYVLLPQLFTFVVWRAVSGRAWRSIRRVAAGYVIGAVVPIALMLAWVLAIAPEAWWEQAVVFPITQNPGLRDLPYSFTPFDFSGTGGVYPFLATLAASARTGFFYYLPFLIALFACALVLAYLRRGGKSPLRDLWGFAATTLVLAASLDYSRVRSDFEHMFPSILLAFLVMPGIIIIVAATVKAAAARRAIAVLGAVIALFAVMIPVLARVRVTEGLLEGTRLDTGPLAGIVIDNRDSGGSAHWDQIDAAAEYVASRTTRDERVFVSTARNDRLFTNFPGFYVLANRLAGTRHAELYPGLTTTEPVQRQIISELEDADVRYVVRWPAGDQPCIEPNLACHPEEEGSTVLDDYIESEYRLTATYDVVEILERR